MKQLPCLLYTSDAADERSSVDLGGRRIIKKKKNKNNVGRTYIKTKKSIYHMISTKKEQLQQNENICTTDKYTLKKIKTI